MAQILQINSQVHTYSVLVCQNDVFNPFQYVIWYRNSDQCSRQVKKELFLNKSQSTYCCTIFDYGSVIALQVVNKYGAIKQYRYGPIQLHSSLQTMKQNLKKINCRLNATFQLNKMQKFSGQIYFSKIQKETLYIQININNQVIQIQHPLLTNWQDYQKLYTLHIYNENTLNISLAKNKSNFVQGLKKLKIFVHYGSSLKVTFFTPEDRSRFLLQLLNITESKTLNFKQQTHRQSLKISQIKNIYSSKDRLSQPITPLTCTQSRFIQDLKGVVYTPKSGVNQEKREFPTYESFLSIDHNKKVNLKKESPIIIENTKTTTSIKIIRQEENEEETQIKNKTNKQSEQNSAKESVKQIQVNMRKYPSMKKSFFKKNHSEVQLQHKKEKVKKIQQKSVSPKSKNSEKKSLPSNLQRNGSYMSALQRNRYLELQNKHLMLENIRLKYEIQSLKFTISRKTKKQTKRNQHMPFFLKNKTLYQDHEKKKTRKKGKYFRHTQGAEVKQKRDRKNSSRSPDTSLSVLRSSIYENHSAKSIYAENNSKSFYSTYHK